MRIRNSIYNIVVGIGSQLLLLLVSFVSRAIFIRELGLDYLGLSGLFTNLLSVLSLLNLGIGGAIAYSLYKPLANRDEEKICAYMSFYRTAYNSVGLAIFVIGLCFMPFIELFMKEVPDIPYIKLIYLLFLINTSASYFFIYKSAIISADQKNYMITVINCVSVILMNTVQVAILIMMRNYILFLFAMLFFTLVQNFYIAWKAGCLYPMINAKSKSKLSGEERREIFKNVYALSVNHISSVVYYGTDNIIISSIIGVSMVGLYYNYSMIVGAVKGMLTRIFSAMTASVGNLSVSEDVERQHFIFNAMYLVNFWVYAFAAISLLTLLNPFIKLWLGPNCLLSGWVVLIIFLDFFMGGVITTSSVFKGSAGLYWHFKYSPLFSAGIKLIISVGLAHVWGVAGVLLGSFFSRILTFAWVDTYIVYKYIFKRSSWTFWRRYFIYVGIAFSTASATWLAAMPFSNSWFGFAGKMAVCALVPNFAIYMLFRRTKEFVYVRDAIFTMLPAHPPLQALKGRI